MPSRAHSPPNEEPVPSAATEPEAPPQPKETETETAMVKMQKFDIRTIKESGNFIFQLEIEQVMAAQLNYDPSKAVGNLNAYLQDSLSTASGVSDIPTGLYSVSFVPPKPGTDKKGLFVCHIPADFKELVTTPEVLSNLEFTGDDEGNNYKLQFANYAPLEKTKKRGKNDTFWFHLIPDESAMSLPRRVLYEGTANHIRCFGMTIQEHEDAFVPKLTKDKEQQDGRKFHVEYEVDTILVPMKYGYANVVGLDQINFDPSIPGATGKLWFRPDLLKIVFGACKICYKHEAICLGHGHGQSNAAGKRPVASADRMNAAKRRIAEKAAKQNNFKF